MSSDLALDRYDPRTTALHRDQLTHEQITLLKNTICKGATDAELQLFVMQCNQRGLSPFAGQIHAVKRWDSAAEREVMTIQTGIDGYRLIAERTGRYDGQRGPWWCDDSGEWHDVWLADAPPSAAKVEVFKTGTRESFAGVATWREYAQRKKNGQLIRMWQQMPAHMLAKVAEALALRKAFPQDLSGIYTDDEMPEEGPNAGAVTTTPAPALAATGNVPTLYVPTLDEISQLRTVRAAKDLIYTTDPDFQALVPRAILALYDGADPRMWWDKTSNVNAWKQVLEYAVELAEHEQSEMSGAEEQIPPPSAPDQTSPSAHATKGKGGQAEGDDPEGGDDG